MVKFILLLFLSFNACADIKLINNIFYGNVCRNGNVFSIRFEPEYWAPVGSECNVLNVDGTIFAKGRIVYD